jgi:hypothetical protein
MISMVGLVSESALFARNSATAPRLIVTELTAPAGDVVAESLAFAITRSLELAVQLSGGIAVEQADSLDPANSFAAALAYYKKVDAAAAVYGSVRPGPGGGYTITLNLWTAAEGDKGPQRYSRSITDILTSFSVADELSLQVASQVVQKKLVEGTLLVRNADGRAGFSVYADGHLVGRNKNSFRLLTGEHRILVAKQGSRGKAAIKIFTVDIKSGRPTVISLSPPRSAARTVPALQTPTTPRSAATPVPVHTGSAANTQSSNTPAIPPPFSVGTRIVNARNDNLAGTVVRSKTSRIEKLRHRRSSLSNQLARADRQQKVGTWVGSSLVVLGTAGEGLAAALFVLGELATSKGSAAVLRNYGISFLVSVMASTAALSGGIATLLVRPTGKKLHTKIRYLDAEIAALGPH